MEANNAETIKTIKCEVCNKDLTYSTNYYKCLECVPDFFWCKNCFLNTEIDTAENFGEEGEKVTSTRSWHIHKFTVVKIDIFTPSKKNHQFD